MNEAEMFLHGPDLVLTMAAVERLHGLLEEGEDTDRKLRIHADSPDEDPSFTLSLEDRAAPEDVELDFARIAVVLDPESRRRLRGHEVDHRRDEDGEYFVIRAA